MPANLPDRGRGRGGPREGLDLAHLAAGRGAETRTGPAGTRPKSRPPGKSNFWSWKSRRRPRRQKNAAIEASIAYPLTRAVAPARERGFIGIRILSRAPSPPRAGRKPSDFGVERDLLKTHRSACGSADRNKWEVLEYLSPRRSAHPAASPPELSAARLAPIEYPARSGCGSTLNFHTPIAERLIP
jgi:hypothetical protein